MTDWLIRTAVNQLWYWFIGYRFNDANGYERLTHVIRWCRTTRHGKA